MQRRQSGTVTRFQYNPWINWSMMIVVAAAGLFGLMYISLSAGRLFENAPEIGNIMATTFGSFVAAGLFGGMITPARAFEIDTAARELRILSLYALGTRRKVFSSQEVAGFVGERVQHMGPEAYWMYAGLRTGRKVKLLPMAGSPEVAHEVNQLIASLLTARPNDTGRLPKRGFGRAA